MSHRVLLSDEERAVLAPSSPPRFVRVDLGRWVRLPHGLKTRTALVGRLGGKLVAYANVCRHQPVPLDVTADPREIAPGVVAAPMADDGVHFLCHSHGAIFRPSDGVCVSGPCAGEALVPLPIAETRDAVMLRIP